LGKKFYSKAEKIKTTTGRLPHNLQSIGIEDWAENKLRIEMSEQIALSDEKMIEIPKRLRMTYRAWLDGHDLRDMTF
jgi:hypothetical protein